MAEYSTITFTLRGSILSQYSDIGYAWRIRSLHAPTAPASATTRRCATTSIRSDSPPASSGTLADGQRNVSGTLAARFPGANALTAYLKNHERYADLHSQSSQRVLQELGEAFTSWYGKRGNEDTNANPPGYRKHDGDHPRSTVTFKQAGFKHDATNNRIRPLERREPQRRLGRFRPLRVRHYWHDRSNRRERPTGPCGVRTRRLAVAHRLSR